MQWEDLSDFTDSDNDAKPKMLYSFKEIQLNNKSHLAEIRIICKNLIYVIGLAPQIAKEEYLRRNDYFGQYGTIHKLIVIQSNTFNPPSHAAMNKKPQWPSYMACEAFPLHDRLVKASFGTTKYCANFLKNQACKIKDCVYLHQHPKDREGTQVLKKKEEMNNSKWLFTYSQQVAQANFKKFYTKVNYKNSLPKATFPTIQQILDKMLEQGVVELEKQTEERKPEKLEQNPLEKKLEQIVMKMDSDNNNSRFKFTNGKNNLPLDAEAINQLKQYVLK